ncbi:MAG: hypothetical protein V4515_07040 [Chloroflexota bacterium]
MTLPDGPICGPMAEAARLDGKLGWVRCPACIAKDPPADASPEVSDEDLADAVRAASGALPGGSLIIMVLVVNEVDGKAVVNCGSNCASEKTRRTVLETALGIHSS